MQTFVSDGVEIAFEVEGQGEPVLLIHGFASNGRVNWVATGWVKYLTAQGFRCITIDNRGHGESEKLYDPAAYPASRMAEDAANLLRHLKIQKAHVMGYSMGARIAAFLSISQGHLVRDVVLAGLAANLVNGVSGAEEIAAAMDTPSLQDVPTPAARAFRAFAQQTGSDLKALSACIRSSREKIAQDRLRGLTMPVLIVAGTADDVAGPIEPLRAIIPGADGLALPGRNHMNALGDQAYRTGVAEFFKRHPLG